MDCVNEYVLLGLVIGILLILYGLWHSKHCGNDSGRTK